MIICTFAGRYLSPEPMLQYPTWVMSELQSGFQVPAYAYACTNPIGNGDPDGLYKRGLLKLFGPLAPFLPPILPWEPSEVADGRFQYCGGGSPYCAGPPHSIGPSPSPTPTPAPSPGPTPAPTPPAGPACGPACPPCPPPPPDRLDKVPPGRPHFPCTGDHTHTFVMNQNPKTCQCSANYGPVICH